MTYLMGKLALDINAGAPNNDRGSDNAGRVKSMWIGRQQYPYVSAQAFRRWLRDSLPLEEPRSPVQRSGKGQSQQAYTAGRPDQYLDDDLFGYMVAVKKENYQRDTVLANGTFVSITPQRPTEDFGTMNRGFAADEDPVIHVHEHYTADLAGDVAFDLVRVGAFEIAGTGLKPALSSAAASEVAAAGAEKVNLRDAECLRLAPEERRRRTAVLLRTLAGLRGGAQQALHYGDRAPAFVLLAPMKGGVNPFTRVLTARNQQTVFDTDVFREELEAWEDELDGTVVLGWAPGFLGEQREHAREQLNDIIDAGRLLVDHPRVALNHLAEEIEGGVCDTWFDGGQP